MKHTVQTTRDQYSVVGNGDICTLSILPLNFGAHQIVGPMLSSQASLIETMSNNAFGLPLVTPSASAARAATYFASRAQGLGTGPSFLFGIQPDIFEQMEALARLVLDMKTERDYPRGG